MVLRAFPVLYAKDVEAVAAFYGRLGFEEHFRLPDEKGGTGFIAMHRDAAELGGATVYLTADDRDPFIAELRRTRPLPGPPRVSVKAAAMSWTPPTIR